MVIKFEPITQDIMQNPEYKNIIVSIIMITYGHEKYIRHAIEGVLMQECNFEFELIVSNDCSPDNTQEIVNKIILNHPKGEKIKYFRHSKNIGMIENSFFAVNQCFGKYTAGCEGDDYWTDPYKLQKQVDFLEQNNEYTLCFTNYKILKQLENHNQIIDLEVNKNIYLIEEIIINNPFAACTSLIKTDYLKSFPDFFKQLPFSDLAFYLFSMNESKSKAYLLNDVTSIYRLHHGGVHGKAHLSNKGMIQAFKQRVKFWEIILENNYLIEYKSQIIKKIIFDQKKLLIYLKEDNYFITYFILKFKIFIMRIRYLLFVKLNP